jgi:hypothetical protein
MVTQIANRDQSLRVFCFVLFCSQQLGPSFLGKDHLSCTCVIPICLKKINTCMQHHHLRHLTFKHGNLYDYAELLIFSAHDPNSRQT